MSGVQPSSLRAAVFDCDGLLVDSSSLWANAFDATAGMYGYRLNDRDHSALIGASIESGAQLIADRASLDVSSEVSSLTTSIQRSLVAQLQKEPTRAMPGALDLVASLQGRVPIAIASNGHRDILKMMLAGAGFSLAGIPIITAADVANGKPHPDVYLAASETLGVQASEVVAFEDSITGAKAALAASMPLVFVGAEALPEEVLGNSLAPPTVWHVNSLATGRVAALRFVEQAEHPRAYASNRGAQHGVTGEIR